MRHQGESCMFYRNADGFCLLTNRCWDGKPCPRSQAEAERARDQLVDDIIARRDAARDSRHG